MAKICLMAVSAWQRLGRPDTEPHTKTLFEPPGRRRPLDNEAWTLEPVACAAGVAARASTSRVHIRKLEVEFLRLKVREKSEIHAVFCVRKCEK